MTRFIASVISSGTCLAGTRPARRCRVGCATCSRAWRDVRGVEELIGDGEGRFHTDSMTMGAAMAQPTAGCRSPHSAGWATGRLKRAGNGAHLRREAICRLRSRVAQRSAYPAARRGAGHRRVVPGVSAGTLALILGFTSGWWRRSRRWWRWCGRCCCRRQPGPMPVVAPRGAAGGRLAWRAVALRAGAGCRDGGRAAAVQPPGRGPAGRGAGAGAGLSAGCCRWRWCCRCGRWAAGACRRRRRCCWRPPARSCCWGCRCVPPPSRRSGSWASAARSGPR